MFPFRLRFQVFILVTIGMRYISGDSVTDLNEGVNFCCKTGLGLDSCSEARINQISYDPPTGVCRTTIRLCCLFSPGITKCEKDLIVNNFDQYCEKSLNIHETCCLACKLGQELTSERNALTAEMMPDILRNDSVAEVISDCFHQTKKKIFTREVKKVLPLGSGLFFNPKTNDWEDINECEIENNGCHDDQDCFNTIGSYACIPRSICAKNYEFDPVALVCKKKSNCSDAIYITIKEDTIPLPPRISEFIKIIIKEHDPSNQSFITDQIFTESRPGNVRVNFTLCRSGYRHNLKTQICEDIDECKENLNQCEHNCRNLNGGFECFCRRGYRVKPGNRLSCVDINECSENKNLCSQNCQNVQGSFRCLCSNNYILGIDRRTCVDKEICPEGFKRIAKNLGKNFRRCIKIRCPTPLTSYCLNKPNYLTYKTVLVRNATKREIIHSIRIFNYSFETQFEMGVRPMNCIDETKLEIVKERTRAIVFLTKSPNEVARKCQLVVKVMRPNRAIVELLTIDLTFRKHSTNISQRKNH